MTPRSASSVQHVAELTVDQVQPAGKSGGERGAARDRLRIAVDRPDGAGRRLEERGRISAAAERAVEIDAAGVRRQQRNDLGQHDGTWVHCGPLMAAGQREAVRPRPLARLGAAALRGFRFPDLKDAAETHEHHGLAKSSIADEVIGQDDPTFLVGFDRKRIRIQAMLPSHREPD